jgi:hypothetical protein
MTKCVSVGAPPMVCSCGSLKIYPTTVIPKESGDVIIYRCVKCKQKYCVGG